MFIDIEKFESEKEQFLNQLKELENSNMDNNALLAKQEELVNNFRIDLRKYLSLALGVIYDLLGVKYSLYHQGKDYDANLKSMQTTVAKSLDDIKLELNNLEQLAQEKALDEMKRKKLSLSIDIITTYALDRDNKLVTPLKVNKIEEKVIEVQKIPIKEDVNNDKSKPIALIIIGLVGVIVAVLLIMGIL